MTQQPATTEASAQEGLRQPPPEAEEAARAARRDDDEEECHCRFAVVDGPTGTRVRGSGVVSSLRFSAGTYQVIFNGNVAGCAYIATIGEGDASGAQPPGEITVAPRLGNNRGVFVTTHNSAGALSDRDFHLVVICPD
ncbi:MAG: hypothetical protein JWO49_1224 [Arthrobacter sp.]|nr:hypothetical protein [Arthrobacter sp.]MCU1548636.1 hypothetical protein [Arthrobacter sp.]